MTPSCPPSAGSSLSAAEIRTLCRQWLQLPSARDPARRRNARIRSAFSHPFNLLLAGWMVVLALSTAPWILPLLLVGCELMILLALRVPLISAHLDAETARAERLRALEARAKLMCEMNEEHQVELERLELLVASIRSAEGDAQAATAAFDPDRRLEHLLAYYAELAIAYREARRRMALTGCASIAPEAGGRSGGQPPAGLDSAGGTARQDRLRSLQELRRRVGHRRAQYFRTNRERLAEMQVELAAIAELVELAHERSVLPGGLRELLAEGEPALDEALADLDGFCDGIQALSEAARAASGAGDVMASTAAVPAASSAGPSPGADRAGGGRSGEAGQAGEAAATGEGDEAGEGVEAVTDEAVDGDGAHGAADPARARPAYAAVAVDGSRALCVEA